MFYETPKLVRIHNRFLGTLYYSLVCIIILGQFGLVLYNRDYLEYDTPKGIIRLSVKSITNQNPGFDEYSAVLPNPLDSDYAFISTGVEEKIEKILKKEKQQSDDTSKMKWKTVSEDFYFIENTEYISLKIEHTMFAPKFFNNNDNTLNNDKKTFEDSLEFVKSSRNLHGTLKSQIGNNILKDFPKGKADTISLNEFLQAANIKLDDNCGVFHHENETIRERGAVLQVSIIYSNTQNYSFWGDNNEIEYQYKITRLPETGYKLTESVSKFDLKSINDGDDINNELENTDYLYRYLIRRYGIHLKFVQEGQLGRFSWSNLVLHVLSALGMLGLLTLIIDYFAIYMIPNFTSVKYFETELETTKDSSKKKR